MTRIEGLLEGVDYHQFYLQAGDPSEYPSYPREGPPNRLLATTDTGHAVCITTGIAMGVVQLAIEFLDGPPPGMDDSHEWEAVTELSFEATETTAVVVLLMANTNPPFRSFELPLGSGWYRMRGYAIGRSLDFDLVVSEPREHHLLQLWRVDQFDDTQVIRADDPWERQRYTGARSQRRGPTATDRGLRGSLKRC